MGSGVGQRPGGDASISQHKHGIYPRTKATSSRLEGFLAQRLKQTPPGTYYSLLPRHWEQGDLTNFQGENTGQVARIEYQNGFRHLERNTGRQEMMKKTYRF